MISYACERFWRSIGPAIKELIRCVSSPKISNDNVFRDGPDFPPKRSVQDTRFDDVKVCCFAFLFSLKACTYSSISIYLGQYLRAVCCMSYLQHSHILYALKVLNHLCCHYYNVVYMTQLWLIRVYLFFTTTTSSHPQRALCGQE